MFFKKLKNKLLLWWRKLLKMKTLNYYCRFYLKQKTGSARIMLPLFISGHSEEAVDQTIYEIYTAIHKSSDYRNDGQEPKIYLNSISPLVPESKHFVEEAFEGKDIAWIKLGIEGYETNINRFPLDSQKYVASINGDFISNSGTIFQYPVCVIWTEDEKKLEQLPDLNISKIQF